MIDDAKRRGLGRGLSSLLGEEDSVAPASTRTIAIELIHPGRYQPRHQFDAEGIEALARSIGEKGVLQPLLVRRHPTSVDEYEIVAGERRWRAAQMAGLAEIPAVIRDVPDESAVSMALIENIQREDLNPLEEAGALLRLIEEFGLTHQAAAEAVGRSRAAVSNLLRLMELADEVKELLEQRRIEMGHARALLGLSSRRQQIEVAGLVARKSLSVRETESLVRRIINPQPANPQESPAVDPDIHRLERELADKLGAKVAFQHTASGKGKLVVSYNSLDELEGILGHIQ